MRRKNDNVSRAVREAALAAAALAASETPKDPAPAAEPPPIEEPEETQEQIAAREKAVYTRIVDELGDDLLKVVQKRLQKYLHKGLGIDLVVGAVNHALIYTQCSMVSSYVADAENYDEHLRQVTLATLHQTLATSFNQFLPPIPAPSAGEAATPAPEAAQ